MSLTHVFSPLQLAGVELPNRFGLTATLTNLGANTRITEQWINFHAERAAGGTGLIITEAVAVDSNAVAHPSVIAAFDPANEQGFSELTRRVHTAGSVVVAQLWHAGRQQLWHPTRSPQGVSDQPDAYSWTVPHVMNDDEIEHVIEAFVSTAGKLKHYGLDGVELHGAHGYLITQFLSPWSNTRGDDWGGSIENRCRFCLRIAEGIRQRCGSEFVIGIKMPADEGVDGGIDIDEAELITRILRSSELFDYFAYSQGNFSLSLENHVPDMHFRSGHFLDYHHRLHSAADAVPIMAVGRIDSPQLAEKVVADGYGEIVGLCRALVADASFVNKAKAGELQDIRPSLYDNFCWGVIHSGRPIAEAQNPQLALKNEASWRPGTSQQVSDIAVVGSGPAGLEAAWLCAARGNNVSLLSNSKTLGGKLRLETGLPGHHRVQQLIDYQVNQCRKYGVNFLPETQMDFTGGHETDRQRLCARDFDHVIIALGSQMRIPDNLPIDDSDHGVDVRSLYSFMRRHLDHQGDVDWSTDGGHCAVVFDQDHSAPVYAAAQLLRDYYERVIVVTPRPSIAETVNYCSTLGIHRRLHQLGVEIRPAVELLRLDSTDVICRNVFSQRIEVIEKCNLLVYATPRRVNELENIGDSSRTKPRIHHIGDCKSPRNLMMAIHEAHALTTEI